ncbi:MAG TPA: biotin carboxylase N-terminal domain-containing protein, partial [Rhizomicrobium sp.]
NRGEIACRIIKTARRMGIVTVAVYSDADRDALHVEMADEAVRIGPAPSALSYLRADAILEAAHVTGAEAIHPGYGFLSERQAFAEAVTKASGLVFIGPSPEAIAAVGDKIQSKKLAQSVNIATIPGFVGEIVDMGHARRIVEDIGYPVIVKSSAGGGGKGLRIVHAENELPQAIHSAHNETRASFGDDRLFIEKFFPDTRHIEIQVVGDKHGSVVSLGERECSIQRRHQKVIEETPSPLLDAAMRAAMSERAVALAKASGYDSVGTVEFVVDKNRKFYFLEMNARLQVEHTVTEMVTGLDLVELMIRVAAGEKLPFAQSDVKPQGWAVEARVYAEDPQRGFLPSAGRLLHYCTPPQGTRGGTTLRIDTGVQEGTEISVHYDPIIAKICTRAPTRDAAIEALADALDGIAIGGIRHNVAFLSAIMHNQRFREGRLSTAFVAEEFPHGFRGRTPDAAAKRRFLAAGVAAELVRMRRASAISGTLNGPHSPGSSFTATLGGKPFAISGATLREGRLFAQIDGEGYAAATDWRPGMPILHLREKEREYAMQIASAPGGWKVSQGGIQAFVCVRSLKAAELATLMPKKAIADTSKLLLCPMPGLVSTVYVEAGQAVKTGEPLVVVEAMKMENVLTAERGGTIGKINVKKGDNLALNDVILEFA